MSTLRPSTTSRPPSLVRGRRCEVAAVARTARRRRSRRRPRSRRVEPGQRAARGLGVARLGDRHRRARLGEPVGRRDRPAGVAGADEQRRVGGRAAEHHDAQRRRRRAVDQPRELGRDQRRDRDVVACRRARAPRWCRRSRDRSSTISPPTWLTAAAGRASAPGAIDAERRRRSRARSPRICASESATGRGMPVVPRRVDDERRRGTPSPSRHLRRRCSSGRRSPARRPARRHAGSRRSTGTAAAPASRHACSATAKSSPGGSAIATRARRDARPTRARRAARRTSAHRRQRRRRSRRAHPAARSSHGSTIRD